MPRVTQSIDSPIGGTKAVVVEEDNVVSLEAVVVVVLVVVGIVGSVGVVGGGTVDMVGSVEVVSSNPISLNLQMNGSSSLQNHSVALQKPFA